MAGTIISGYDISSSQIGEKVFYKLNPRLLSRKHFCKKGVIIRGKI